MKKNKFLIAILTYNCRPKMELLYEELILFENKIKMLAKEKIEIKVIIFDDFSSDGTQEFIIKKFKKNYYFTSSKNLGYGGNVKRCFKFAKLNNFDYLSIFPGDMQRSFKDLLKMIKIANSDKYDVIIGKKFKINGSNKMPLDRKGGNYLFYILSKLWGDKTTEPLSGFKIYKIKTCTEIVWLCQDKFGFDLDFSFWSSIKKLQIHPFNASVSYEKHISSIKSTFFQGLTLSFRSFIIGFILQPIILILKKSTKKN